MGLHRLRPQFCDTGRVVAASWNMIEITTALAMTFPMLAPSAVGLVPVGSWGRHEARPVS